MRGEDSSFVHVSNDNTDGAKGLYKSCGWAVRSGHGIRSILLRQHEQGTWSNQEHFRDTVPKEPLGTVLIIIPCGNISKGYLIKYFILLTKGFSECLHLTCKLGQVAD